MKLSAISKVIVTSILLTSITGIAFAGHPAYKGEYKDEVPCPKPPMLLDGFYLGAQAGYDAFRVRQTFTGTDVDGGFSAVGSVTGWVGGIFAGYGQYFNNYYYLAGEILGNYNGSNQTTLSETEVGASASQSVKAKGTFGLSLLPGLKLNDTSLGYLRLGYDWTNFEGKGTATVLGSTVSTSHSKTQGGWDLGIGIETLVYYNWSVRTEYNHIWYNSFSSGNSSINESFDPSDNQFMLGVVYHFT